MNLATLKAFTQARIGLNRSGHAISTRELLNLRLATAQAQDAVWAAWDVNATSSHLEKLGFQTVILSSLVDSRSEFLKRPDLGRQLKHESKIYLSSYPKSLEALDVVFMISDGLSARAVEHHFLPLLSELEKEFAKSDLKRGPLCLCPFSRVAIMDEVGSLLGTKLIIMFIGERPGLSAVDSLSIYLTYNPKPGNRDSERNCISNIRPPEGLSYQSASHKLMYLIRASLKLQISGVKLKEGAIGTKHALKS